jgi:histidine triad (HIT) family protein
MSLDGQYDESNIFARIIRGEIPSARIYEDETTLAIMDAFPQARGHALVLHKTSRARNLLDAEPQALSDLIATVQKIARASRTALKPDGLTVIQFNGAPAGQTIFHLHFHILPKWEGVAAGPHAKGQGDPAELAALASTIASEIR